MKKNLPKIPILKPAQFDDFIFMGWKAPNSDFYESFHIERIENYKSNLQLPLLPHRRSIFFFIFLTKGQAIRSKGLTNYVIEANQFFFLPANQITSLEYVSEDAEGFYCHFMPEIFNQPTIKIDLEKEFPFLQLTAEPLLKTEESERFMQILEILFDENSKNQQSRFDLMPIYLLTLFSRTKTSNTISKSSS
ncbi:MAG: AraC family ligand binding domain-containing protein [Arcicella sp.]|nr:AraC family ligand binding domain-containing protein [Arcicella sp.]